MVAQWKQQWVRVSFPEVCGLPVPMAMSPPAASSLLHSLHTPSESQRAWPRWTIRNIVVLINLKSSPGDCDVFLSSWPHIWAIDLVSACHPPTPSPERWSKLPKITQLGTGWKEPKTPAFQSCVLSTKAFPLCKKGAFSWCQIENTDTEREHPAGFQERKTKKQNWLDIGVAFSCLWGNCSCQ